MIGDGSGLLLQLIWSLIQKSDLKQPLSLPHKKITHT